VVQHDIILALKFVVFWQLLATSEKDGIVCYLVSVPAKSTNDRFEFNTTELWPWNVQQQKRTKSQ